MQNLLRLDGARLVRVCEEVGIVFIWFGGYTVNIYDDELNYVDQYSIDTIIGMNSHDRKTEKVLQMVLAARKEVLRIASRSADPGIHRRRRQGVRILQQCVDIRSK